MYYLRKKKTKPKEFQKSPTKKSVSALVRKLDRVFSEYIRLRDSKPYGYKYFKCISCGMVKPYEQMDCGHFIGRTHMATRFDEKNCNGECKSCLTPDMRILTKDLTWVPLGEVKVGDRLFAFTEGREYGRQRGYCETVVLSADREVRDVYEVEFENGDVIRATADHKWLVESRGGYIWARTDGLWCNGRNIYGNKKRGPHTQKVCTVACKPIEVVEQDTSNDAGWLAGMIDADGHLCQQNIHDPDGTLRYGFRIGVAQSEIYPDICERIQRLITYFTQNKPCTQMMERYNDKHGIRSTCQTYQYLVTGSNIEKVMFLQRVHPMKMKKLDINKLGQLRCRYNSKVKSIRSIGKREVVLLETDSHTFIAEGYAMHNCNRFSADHIIFYQRNLVQKYGQEAVDMLIARGKSSKKWTAWELEILITHYTEEVKRMKNGD